jgi:hypothetical protein
MKIIEFEDSVNQNELMAAQIIVRDGRHVVIIAGMHVSNGSCHLKSNTKLVFGRHLISV